MDPFYDLDPYDQGEIPISQNDTSAAEYVEISWTCRRNDEEDDNSGEYLTDDELDSASDDDEDIIWYDKILKPFITYELSISHADYKIS